MPPPVLDDVALARRRLGLLNDLAAQATLRVGAAWRNLGEFDDIDRWLAKANPVLTAAESRAIDIQIAYLHALLGDVPFDRQAILAAVTLDPSEPFIALGRAINAGRSFRDALEAGAARAEGLAASAVTRAARAANTAVPVERVVGWRRTLNGPSCEWCRKIATQRYQSAESAAFGHLRCNCGVDPILGDRDPGRVINAEHTQPEP